MLSVKQIENRDDEQVVIECVEVTKDIEDIRGLLDSVVIEESFSDDGRKTQTITLRYRFIGNMMQKIKRDTEMVSLLTS